MYDLVYPCKPCLDLSRKVIYKRGVIIGKRDILGRTDWSCVQEAPWLEGIRKRCPKQEHWAKALCYPLREILLSPVGNTTSFFNPTNCPLIQQGELKPLTRPPLTKNFKEIKCSLVNCPFLSLYFSLTRLLQQTPIYNPLQRERRRGGRRKKQKNGKINLLEILSK